MKSYIIISYNSAEFYATTYETTWNSAITCDNFHSTYRSRRRKFLQHFLYTKLTASSVCESYVAVLLAVHVSMHDITEMELSRN